MPSGTSGDSYSERLTVPLRWWVQATMLLASLWLAFVVALPLWAASAATGALLLVIFAFFLWIGSARIAVRDGVLLAGPARIEVRHLGGAARRSARTRPGAPLGVDADARAFLLTRPYLKRSVKVEVTDPADPTPYWLVSTRHPDRLVSALGRRPMGSTH